MSTLLIYFIYRDDVRGENWRRVHFYSRETGRLKKSAPNIHLNVRAWSAHQFSRFTLSSLPSITGTRCVNLLELDLINVLRIHHLHSFLIKTSIEKKKHSFYLHCAIFIGCKGIVNLINSKCSLRHQDGYVGARRQCRTSQPIQIRVQRKPRLFQANLNGL